MMYFPIAIRDSGLSDSTVISPTRVWVRIRLQHMFVWVANGYILVGALCVDLVWRGLY